MRSGHSGRARRDETLTTVVAVGRMCVARTSETTGVGESMTNRGSAGSEAGQVLAAAMAAYERGDLDGLAALVHPEAEIRMLLLGEEVARGPNELREALERRRSLVHEPTMTHVEAVSDDAAIMVGRIQYTDTQGGITDREAAWLTVLRDGRIWRTWVFASADEARSAYAGMSSEAAESL
jgi:ketosteroid isomerase-like protein